MARPEPARIRRLMSVGQAMNGAAQLRRQHRRTCSLQLGIPTGPLRGAGPGGLVGAENLCHLAGCSTDCWLLGPAPAWAWDDLRLVGLKLIFLIVTRAVWLLGWWRRVWWWKDAEILMLRHQLAVAERERPRAHSRLRWPARAWLALLAGTVPAERLAARRLIVTPARSRAGSATSSAAGGRACRAGAAPGARQRIARCGRWCCGWPGRTSRGDTGGSTASSRGSASRWRRPRSGRSSRAPRSTRLRAGMARAGRNSFRPRPR